LEKCDQKGYIIDKHHIGCKHSKFVEAMEIIRDAPRFCLYLLRLGANSLSAHSCSAWAKDGEGICNVGGFDGAIFDSVASHHFKELGISWVANHGLGLAGGNGILDFALGVAFIALADGLDHGHGVCGMHVNVRESRTHAILLAMEGDLFALGGGDDPVVTGVVADRESICL
jgi:hypothetical protein